MSIGKIDAAPKHIQLMVLKMAEEGRTHQQIANWLSAKGVLVSRHVVGYHLRNLVVCVDRQWWTDHADTFAGRMEQYTAALELRGSDPFRLFDLNLKGRVWGACTSKLLVDGVIEKVPGQRKWYRVVDSAINCGA